MTTPITDNPRKKAVLLALLFLAMLAGTIRAAPATRIWIGKVDPFWSNPANWTNGLVPVAGDSLEFLDDVKFRDTYNDLDPDMTIGSMHIKGRNYVLRGNRINLQDNIISQPSNSSNLITLNLNINAPLSIINYGYFNVLELAGEIKLYWHPLVLETSSLIRLSGLILDTNNMSVIQRAAGRVEFAATGQLLGTMVVERGELLLGGASSRLNIFGLPNNTIPALTVGRDTDPPGYARVTWHASNKLANDVELSVHRSGFADLGSFSETVATLSGAGVVNLDAGQLTVQGPAPPSTFAGELRGNGTFRLDGTSAGFELSGHNSFTGAVELASLTITNGFPPVTNTHFSELALSGSASNAAVRLLANAVLRGNGVARSLTATNGLIRPGPGALRFLESFSLDAASTLEIDLDGPAAAMIQAHSIDLGGATLALNYHGPGPESLFPLIAANASSGAWFEALPEGTWIISGDPGAPSEFRLTYSGNGGHDVVLERTGLFVPPTLNIRLSGIERVIEWPLAAQGYSLQRSLSLDPPDWTSDGLPTPDATATDFFVIDESVDGERFYRLKR